MTDEEKKVIENLKTEYEKLIKEGNILFPLYKSDAKRLIDIIENQQKEIEELKEQNKEMNKTKIVADSFHKYMSEKFDKGFVSKDKIKAKIEKYKWAIESYDCDKADYKQSQAVGAWNVLRLILKESEIWNEKKND